MRLKRTRKQRTLKGGVYTKARRGVIRNWWGDCGALFKDDKRKRTRCLLDQQRSLWEAHAEDPSTIYDQDARLLAFIKKIKISKLSVEKQAALIKFIVDKEPLEAASENPKKVLVAASENPKKKGESHVDYSLTKKQMNLYDNQ